MNFEIAFQGMVNEEEIINNIQQGKNVEEGFRTLMRLYQEKLYWHIRSILKSHEDTNDVLQNTFLKTYKNIGQFKSDARFYTWIYRIATNESLNFLSKNKRRATSGLEDHELMINNLNADTEIDGDKAQKVLAMALDELPDKQKLVFQMKYYEEMNYKDMSEILDTSVGALKASFHHAVKKIEAFVKNASYEL